MKRNKYNHPVCSQCGKVLITISPIPKNDGAAAHCLQKAGFVVKHLLYYGDPQFHVFCSKACYQAYMQENVTPEQKQDGDKAVESLRQRLEKDKDKLANTIDRVVTAFRKIQTRIKDEI